MEENHSTNGQETPSGPKTDESPEASRKEGFIAPPLPPSRRPDLLDFGIGLLTGAALAAILRLLADGGDDTDNLKTE